MGDSICGMKRKMIISLLAASFAVVSSAQDPVVGRSMVSVGARQHAAHSEFEELPFDDGDISYGVAYEYHEMTGYWQVALDYAPDVSGTNSTDYVVTPQISLIFKDRAWRGGLGLLKSYIRDNDGEADWTDFYWQMILGLDIPLLGMEFNVLAYYVFEEWGEVGDFDVDELEFGAWLKFSF